MFPTSHQQLCYEAKLGAMPDPWIRLEYHKAIIQASAQYVREYAQDCKDDISFGRVMALPTLAAAVWIQS